MKKALLTLAAVAGMVASAQAQISYDGFDYTVGGTLKGNTNWIGINSGTSPTIAAGSLSVPGLKAPMGNKVSFAAGNIEESLGALNVTTSDTVYYSFAFQLTALPTGTATYSFALATGNTNYGAAVWLRGSGAGFEIGLSNRSNSTPTYSTTVFDLNTTIFLVGSYTFVTGTGNDSSALWINPSSLDFGAPTAPTPTLTAVGGADLTAVSQFLIRGAAGSPSGLFDELRVGSDWASVTPVPEPHEYAVAMAGLLLTVVVMRRRAQRA